MPRAGCGLPKQIFCICGPWGRSLRLAEFVNPSMKTAGFRHPDRERAFHDELGLRPLSRRLQVLVHPKVLPAQEIFGNVFLHLWSIGPVMLLGTLRE